MNEDIDLVGVVRAVENELSVKVEDSHGGEGTGTQLANVFCSCYLLK
jgi:hypothetical protein